MRFAHAAVMALLSATAAVAIPTPSTAPTALPPGKQSVSPPAALGEQQAEPGSPPLWTYFLSPLAILASATVAARAIVANVRINNRNRRIKTTIDLFNVYYARDLVERRFKLYRYLDARLEAGHPNWDFEVWFGEAIAKPDSEDFQHVVTLNQLLTFFKGMNQLIRQEEIDEEVANALFFYTYAHWDKYREKFEAGSAGAKVLFEPLLLRCATGDKSKPGASAGSGQAGEGPKAAHSVDGLPGE